jgi:hypothetical protein
LYRHPLLRITKTNKPVWMVLLLQRTMTLSQNT